MKHRIFVIFIILTLFSCDNSREEETSQTKSLIELMNEEAKDNVKELEESKRKLGDLSNAELIQLITNPKEEEKELLVEYISIIDTETFHFEPLKANEKLDYVKINHYYFEESDESIDTYELIIYRILSNGERVEIKRFNRVGSVKAGPEDYPGFIYFYVNDVNDNYGLYLWEIDGYNGIGKLILSEPGYRIISKNGKYLIKRDFVKHLYIEKEYDFPIIEIYSISEEKIVKEIDLFDSVQDEISEDDLIEGIDFEIYKENSLIIANLRAMGSKLPQFVIDQETLEISRLE